MAQLGKTHELGLSVDSGHGWLNGPDISDMAIFESRCGKGTKVFGPNLPAEDEQKEAVRARLFEFAQMRTLQESKEILKVFEKFHGATGLAHLESVAVSNLESFRSVAAQPDSNPAAHVGGANPRIHSTSNHVSFAGGYPQLGAGAYQPTAGTEAVHIQPLSSFAHPAYRPLARDRSHNNVASAGQALTTNTAPDRFPREDTVHQATSFAEIQKKAESGAVPPTTKPQFPLIFNGYNLSAEVGGWCHLIQQKVASPKSYPLQPGTLTESQVQWLMEHLWAQRAFLSSYTTSIIANQDAFAHVHSLHLAKISSGLLTSLEQAEFWEALPGLSSLTVLVSPDWRAEYVTGDENFNFKMPISPVTASVKLTEFLEAYVAPWRGSRL